jgi:hypothetical protein
MNPSTLILILGLIDHLALAVNMAPKVKAEFDAISVKVREMVAEGRDPTREEWDELAKRHSDAATRLRRAAAVLNDG